MAYTAKLLLIFSLKCKTLNSALEEGPTLCPGPWPLLAALSDTLEKDSAEHRANTGNGGVGHLSC